MPKAMVSMSWLAPRTKIGPEYRLLRCIGSHESRTVQKRLLLNGFLVYSVIAQESPARVTGLKNAQRLPRWRLFGTRMSWEKYYSRLRLLPERYKRPVPLVAEILPALKLRKVRNVLDLGCGAGRHCVFLASKGFDVLGLDASESALRMASQWIRMERLANVALVQGSMTDIPSDDDHFEAVISISVMHHALKKEISRSMAEIHRILKKDGIFFANLASIHDPRYGTGQEVEENTFRLPEAFEEKRFEELHHFFTKREVSELLVSFAKADVKLLKDKPNYWKVTAIK